MVAPLFTLCRSCGGLDQALQHVIVPLPEPGRQLLLPSARLSVEEKAFFDRLATPATDR